MRTYKKSIQVAGRESENCFKNLNVWINVEFSQYSTAPALLLRKTKLMKNYTTEEIQNAVRNTTFTDI